jgi:hypothetical protein
VARPGRRNLLSLPSGVGPLSLFRTMPATIHTIVNTEPCSKSGRNAPMRKIGLSLPGHVVPQILTAPRRSAAIERSERVSESYNHPEGAAVAQSQLGSVENDAFLHTSCTGNGRPLLQLESETQQSLPSTVLVECVLKRRNNSHDRSVPKD